MEDNCFTILWWFLPYINMNWPQGYICPPILNSPSSSLPTPSSGLSQSTSFGCPASYIILVLAIYFTYGNVHVSILFSQISHPCLLPLSIKVCSLHLCLLCCPACRIVITVFLNSIGSVQFSRSDVSDALWPQGLQHARLLCVSSTPGACSNFMSIESVMPSNHLILCFLLLLLPLIPPSIRVFSNDSVCRIKWPEYWSFSFSISPSKEYSGLISFRMD